MATRLSASWPLPTTAHPTTMRLSTMALRNLRYSASQMKTLGLRTMDFGMSFSPADAGAGHPIQMHGRVLSYELRGIMTKSRSSSSASRAVQIPALSKAALQDGTYQPGGAYHTTHEARQGQERH
jgi:hypothetical protein